MGTAARLAFGCALVPAQPVQAFPAGEDAAPETARAPSRYDRDLLERKLLTLHGLASAGFAWSSRADAGRGSPRGYGEGSRIGLRGNEVLAGGWSAELDLEAALPLVADCGQQARTNRVQVALSNPLSGRVDVGYSELAAWRLALRVDPWRGNGIAAPGHRLFVTRFSANRCGDATAASPRERNLGYHTPREWPLRLSLQRYLPADADPAATGSGAVLAWDRRPWLAGVGVARFDDGTRAAPAALQFDSGIWRVGVVYTRGHASFLGAPPQRYENLFIGASGALSATGVLDRHEWRAGIDRHRVEPRAAGGWPSDHGVSIGWKYRLSGQSSIAASAAWRKPHGEPARGEVAAVFDYAFERDLRWPVLR